jgi:polysaccharide biosynthesis PFTS motif protein
VDRLFHNNQKLIKSIVVADKYKKRLTYPIPADYWDFFEIEGFKINKLLCTIALIYWEFCQAARQNISLLLNCLIHTHYNNLRENATLVFGLNHNNFIRNNQEEKCFESWFIAQNLEFINTYAIDVKDFSVSKSGIENYSLFHLFDYNFINFIKFYLGILGSNQTLTKKFLFLRHARELFQVKYLRPQTIDTVIAIYYLSSLPSVIPLWINKLQYQNTRTVYVNLSSATNPKVVSDGEVTNIEALNQWNEVWVVNDYHASKYTINNVNSKSSIVVKGVPYWADNLDQFIDSSYNFKYCAIFDIQPSRSFLGGSTLYDCGFTDSLSVLKFISDIAEVTDRLGIKCILKSKRNNPRYLDADYEAGIKELQKKYKNLVKINSDISPHRVISRSRVTISLPFTTTAIIAQEYKVPNFFYDPIGKILPNDPGACGVKIINTKLKLYTELYKLSK